MLSRLSGGPLVAVLVLVGTVSKGGAQTTTIVWPANSDIDVEAAQAVVAKRGDKVIDFAPLRAKLDELRNRRDGALAESVEKGLAEVRAAYLEQRWADMLLGLDKLETSVLATPEAIGELLWDVELYRGIAYHARGEAGDAEREVARFELANALAESRRPPDDVFGPRISAAFTAAVDARSRKVVRPVTLSATPADAVVSIDGKPWSALAGVELRPGLHTLAFAAPGYATNTRLLTIGTEPITARLQKKNDSALVSLAATWGAATGPSRAAALRKLAAEYAATRVIIVSRSGANYEATVLEQTETHAPSVAPTAPMAVEAALLALAPPLPPVVGPEPGETARPIYKKWWFWTGVAVVAVATGVTAGVLLSERKRRLEVITAQ